MHEGPTGPDLDPPGVRTTWSSRLPAVRGSVEVARRAALAFLEPFQLCDRTRFDLELVLEELLVNVVLHGYGPDVEGFIDLSIDVAADNLRLRLADDGIAFDPQSVPENVRAMRPDAATPGGLGIRLVRQRVRELEYLHRDGRNVTTATLERR